MVPLWLDFLRGHPVVRVRDGEVGAQPRERRIRGQPESGGPGVRGGDSCVRDRIEVLRLSTVVRHYGFIYHTHT